jgi:hypothetical protein
MEAFANGAVTKLTKINKKRNDELTVSSVSTTTAGSTVSSTAVGAAATTPNNNRKDYRKSSDPIRLQVLNFIHTMIDKSKFFQDNPNSPVYLSAVKDMDADDLLKKVIDETYKKMFGTFTTKTFIINDLNESFAAELDEEDIVLWNERDTITIVPFPKNGLYYIIQNFIIFCLYFTLSHFTC